MFGQNQNWNNRRESYIKAPNPEEAERKKNLLERMKQTISKSKTEDPGPKPTLKEISEQKHFDLDSSIAAEVKKTVKIIQPKIKPKLNPIVIPQPKEETKEEEKPVKKPYLSFTPPDPVDPNIDDYIKSLDNILEYLDKADTEYSLLQKGLHQADQETSDLLHSIELTEDFGDNEKQDMIDKLKEVRLRRRTFKWRIEYFTEITEFCNNNKKLINELKTLKGKLNSIREKHDNASYRIRFRTDLKPCDKIHS